MSETIIPRWEWRTFGERIGDADRRLASLVTGPAQESDELYLLGHGTEASVKVRDGLMDVKRLVKVDEHGLEQWRPVMKAPFPLREADVTVVLEALGAPIAPERSECTQEQLVALIEGQREDLLAVEVHKRRSRLRFGGCMGELSEFRVEHGSVRTLALESEDPDLLIAAVRELGLASRHNVSVPRELKALAGLGARRYAVIDVGTNSVKFHIGERAVDGAWRAIVDRAEVTRLGQDLERTGRLGEEAIVRTVRAIEDMAEEAARNDVESIVAVGTAGLRRATNRDALIDAVGHVPGVEVEVIPGEEEARLAYLATAAELDVGDDGTIVVFDTGGGSSQFTIGHGRRVEERFSLEVGAVRYMERFGLDSVVEEAQLERVLGAIAADLERLDGLAAADRVIGMGGAVTNLAAVKHGLAVYDRDVVQGTVLDLAEIDRQIGLYRTHDAEQRREIVGLQPNRAPVILAGACIVRGILVALGGQAVTVSDRGLRHGLLVERFPHGT